MKKPSILLFPIAAELLLYASGFPIQHKYDKGVVIRSDNHQPLPPISNLLNPPPSAGNQPSQHPVNSAFCATGPGLLCLPGNVDTLSAHGLADELEHRAARLSMTEGKRVVEILELMKIGFETSLYREKPKLSALDALINTWRQVMDAIAHGKDLSEADMQAMNLVTLDFKAITNLYRGSDEQKAWDAHWMDDPQSSTTRLQANVKYNPSENVLSIEGRSLFEGYLYRLEKTPNTIGDLLQMAAKMDNHPLDMFKNNALVLRRKAIQMWISSKTGISKVDLDKEEKKLRDMVAHLDDSNLTKIRAEMVIISLQRFYAAKVPV